MVLEIEPGNVVVAKALMLRGGMRIKRRREIRKGREKGIETATGTENGKRRRRREAMPSLTSLNLKVAQGTRIPHKSPNIFQYESLSVIDRFIDQFFVNFADLRLHAESAENAPRFLDRPRYILVT